MSIGGIPSHAPVGMDGSADNDAEQHTYLSTTPARPKDWRLTLWMIGISALLFLCVLPFAHMPLAKIPVFVSSYESALAISDLITATLLFGKFTRLLSRALLALACGYLFVGLIIIPHALTFPGVFSPAGLLGAGSQSTAWLYAFWHGGLPVFVQAYALLRTDTQDVSGAFRVNPGWAIAGAVVGVAIMVCAFTLLSTVGMDRLPVIIEGGHFSRLVSAGTSPFLLTLSPIALVALWRRKRPTVLDLWLIVVMCAWLFGIVLSVVISSARYDLGWYAGRSYDLLGASFVLVILLLETMWLHDRLATAQRRLANRARDLEQRVRLRTNELRLSNETLKSEISERLQAEQELLSTRTFLDVIIDNVPAMLLLKDAKTRKVVYLNRAGEELTGIDRGEIVGKSVYEVMPSLNANLIDLQDTQLIESGKPCESYEITLVTRHRGVRLVRTKKLVVPDEKGEPKYLLGFCEDVTEQRQTEEQLRHAHKMKALGQLTGGLAHDFNNLLAIIIGNLDVLSDSMAADTEQRELVQSAIGAAISGSELTRRLLAFARRQPLLPEQVDLNALLDDLSRLPPGAATVPLTVGARIIHKERIHTTPTGTVQLAFLDKSTLSIAPNTSIVINEFIYDPDSGNGHMLASLTQGALRFVDGALSHQGDASIATPAAAIGIRGGTVSIVFGPNGAEIINHFGIITIHNGAGTVTINRPDFKVLVLNWNTLPGPIERVLVSDIEHLPRFTSLPSENGGVPGLHTANIGECGILGLRSNNCPDVPWVPTDSGLNGANQIITQGTQFGTSTTQAHRPPGR